MISNKKINSIIAFFTLLAIGFSLFIWLKPNSTESSLTSSGNFSYLNTVFNKDSITEINITIDEDNWNNLLENASAEEYTNADVTVNGKTYYNVGIRAKGNSSLSQVASDDTTDRYSFKIKFDKYIDGQTLDGLSKIALNNVISDATYMKEYLSYDLLSKIGVKTPAFAFTNITVNGEAWGLYFGVEVIEEEFLERYYGSSTGNLYKPDSMDMNNKPDSMDMNNKDEGIKGQGGNPPSDMNNAQGGNPPSDMNNVQGGNPPSDMNNAQGGNPPSGMNNTQGGNPPSDMNIFQGNTSAEETNNKNSVSENFISERPNMGAGMNGAAGGMGSSGGTSLVYTDDNLSSYSSVLDSAVFDWTTDEDKAKVVEMIKNLNEGTNLEEYLNVDDILKYFAVNTFIVNLDSYASNMKHNYYLYENNGVFDILPWDYNLAFGAFGITDASSAINFPIDSPVTDTLENSPLIGKLLEVDEYKEKYHEYLQEIVDYVNDGTYVNTINAVDSLISNYVKNDATAFYTYEEYLEALPNLINFGLDRAKSIEAQLSGEQPSTSYGNISTTVDLKALGTNGAGGGDKSPGGKENIIMPNPPNTSVDATTSASVSTDKTGGSNNNQNKIPNMNNNLDNITNDQSDNNNQNTDSNNNNLSEIPSNNENSTEVPTMDDKSNFNNMDKRGDKPFNENMNSSLLSKDTILLYGGSIVVLIVGLAFTFTFKRRKYTP